MTLLRRALARSAALQHAGPARVDVNAEVAAARRDLHHLAARLDRLRAELGRPETVTELRAVDGLFVGDTPAAVETTRLWLERSRSSLASPEHALAEAHVAAGSLASR